MIAALGKFAVGVLLIALLGLSATRTSFLPGSLSSAQNRLQQKAEAALGTVNTGWAYVRLDGQKAVLQGDAPTLSERDNAAAAIAGSDWAGGLILGGVTVVDVAAEVAPPPALARPARALPEQETDAPLEAENDPIADIIVSTQAVASTETQPPATEPGAPDAVELAGEAQADAASDTLPEPSPLPESQTQPSEADVREECTARLQNVIAGRTITFATSRVEIDAPSRDHLQDIAAALTDCPDMTLLVSGHTDSRGASERNRRLSLDRANAVANYLTSYGVNDAALQTRGLGSTEPIASNATLEGRAQNRRIEITVVTNLPE